MRSDSSALMGRDLPPRIANLRPSPLAAIASSAAPQDKPQAAELTSALCPAADGNSGRQNILDSHNGNAGNRRLFTVRFGIDQQVRK